MKSFDQIMFHLPKNGWLSDDEALALWTWAKRTTGAILEVGCYYGRSTCLLAELVRLVYSVDPFTGFDSGDPSGDRIEAAARKATARFGNVTIFRQRIEDWTPLRVGFAYLDGDHTYDGTLAQIDKALQCHPSIIAVHDVNDDGEGVKVRDAAIERLGPWTERVERLAVWDRRGFVGV